MKIEHIYEIIKTTTLRRKLINKTTRFFIKTTKLLMAWNSYISIGITNIEKCWKDKCQKYSENMNKLFTFWTLMDWSK